jgi:hypothetical protein
MKVAPFADITFCHFPVTNTGVLFPAYLILYAQKRKNQALPARNFPAACANCPKSASAFCDFRKVCGACAPVKNLLYYYQFLLYPLSGIPDTEIKFILEERT